MYEYQCEYCGAIMQYEEWESEDEVACEECGESCLEVTTYSDDDDYGEFD